MKLDISELKKLIKEEYKKFMDENFYEIEDMNEVEFIGFEDKGEEWYEKNNPVGDFEKIGSHIKESNKDDLKESFKNNKVISEEIKRMKNIINY